MPKIYKMIVLSKPTAGKEDAYNDWYQNTHLKQMCSIEGVKSAQRFMRTREVVPGFAWPYAAIYEIETDDIDGVLARIRGVAGSENLWVSDALDTSEIYASIFESFGENVEAG